jgi:hypothetical protein
LAVSPTNTGATGRRRPGKQIVFEGERFDVMSARWWREKVLAAKLS